MFFLSIKRKNYTTGLLDILLDLCYNDDSEGENFTDILTNERVKTMNAIMNRLTAMSTSIWNSEYQQSSCFLQQEDNSSIVLRTRHKYACSVALTG